MDHPDQQVQRELLVRLDLVDHLAHQALLDLAVELAEVEGLVLVVAREEQVLEQQVQRELLAPREQLALVAHQVLVVLVLQEQQVLLAQLDCQDHQVRQVRVGVQGVVEERDHVVAPEVVAEQVHAEVRVAPEVVVVPDQREQQD